MLIIILSRLADSGYQMRKDLHSKFPVSWFLRVLQFARIFTSLFLNSTHVKKCVFTVFICAKFYNLQNCYMFLDLVDVIFSQNTYSTCRFEIDLNFTNWCKFVCAKFHMCRIECWEFHHDFENVCKKVTNFMYVYKNWSKLCFCVKFDNFEVVRSMWFPH